MPRTRYDELLEFIENAREWAQSDNPKEAIAELCGDFCGNLLKHATRRKSSRCSLNQAEGTVEVCCHRVNYRYWGFRTPITDELKDSLQEAAEERSQELIVEGYVSGELNHVYTTGDRDEEIRGWWEIDRS